MTKKGILMVTTTDVKTYLKEQGKFVGATLLTTAVGGISGGVAQAILSYASVIPLVTSSSLYSLPALGATLGFAASFIRKYKA
jgi:hypothetical protein